MDMKLELNGKSMYELVQKEKELVRLYPYTVDVFVLYDNKQY